jgi:hypothetical protein
VRAAASGRFLDGPWTAEAQVDLEPTGAPFGWELARSGTARATLADAALARIAGLPPGATGRIGAEAELTGFRPLTGTLRARAPDARVPVPGLDAPAENLSLTATLRGDDRVRLAGEAWIGHGRVGLEGLASRREARVRAAVEKVLVRDRAGLLARASGTLFFIGDRDGGLVTGTVFPDPLEVTARFDPTELPAPREHGPATPGRRLERVNLDVRIAGGRVLVENPDVTARFRPDLRVAGTAAAPRIEGSVRVEPGGELRLPTARLELREATLTFEDGDPARPMLAAVATTRLGDTELFVRAHGRAAEPDLDVHSLPPLPREDVIALLATGFTRAELAASRGGRDEDVRSLRALLDEPRQRELASRTGLGGVLERLEAQRVRPLDVGTRPGDTPGAPPTATGESPGRLIYRLTETLGLSAERDAYGDLNFNLLLRFRFP